MPYFVNTSKSDFAGQKNWVLAIILDLAQTLSQRHDGKEFAALPDNVQEVHLLIRQQGFDPKLFL